MKVPFRKGAFPIIVQIWELRAGNVIRIHMTRATRKRNPDSSEHYEMENGKTIEAQEFSDIFIGTKGQQILMVFSPRPNVFLPIKFLWRIVGKDELTTEEEAELNQIVSFTPEETQILNMITDPKSREKEKNKQLQIKEKEKEKLYKKILKKKFDVEIATQIDSDTINHLVYKLQKNKLRLTPKGLSPTVVVAILVVFCAIAILVILWGSYNYWLAPQLEFLKTTQDQLLQLYGMAQSGSAPVPAGPTPTT